MPVDAELAYLVEHGPSVIAVNGTASTLSTKAAPSQMIHGVCATGTHLVVSAPFGSVLTRAF